MNTPRLSITLVLVLALAAACGTPDRAAGHGSTSAPPTASPSPPGHSPCGLPSGPGYPSLAPVSTSDATAVGCSALVLLFSLDTTIDSAQQTQHAGELRAANSPYVTLDYANDLRTREPIPLPGGTWQMWTRHRAYISITVAVADSRDAPPDTATTAYRQFHLTNRPTGRDGWYGPAISHDAFSKLTRASANDPWRVASFTID